MNYVQPGRHEKVKDIYVKVLNGKEETSEITIEVSDILTKHFSLKYKPARDEHSDIIGVFISAIDITDQKLAEAHQEFERRDKEALINTTTDLMWSVSKEYKLIAANDAFINSLAVFTGFRLQPGDELLMKEQFSSEYLAFWEKLYSAALKGTPLVQEIHFPGSKDQAETWGEINFNPIYDGDEVTGVACHSRDTTSSKNFKTELIDINKKLETAQQIASLGYWELDKNVDSLYWSNEVYNIWGVSPDTFNANFKNFYETIHPDDRKKYVEAQMNVMEGKDKMDIEHRIILPTGKIKYVQSKADLVRNQKGEIIRIEGTVQDITERKELANLLNKANRLALIGTWEVDLIKNTLYWSEITKEIHGVDQDYIPDLATAINFYKEGTDRALILQKVEKAMEDGSPWDVELQINTTQGLLKWVRAIGEGEFSNGKVVKIIGSFQDIDVRKKHDSEVAQVLADKNAILESIDDAFFAVDKNWIVTYWNRQAEKVLVKTKSEMIGNNLWSVFSDSIDSDSYKHYHKAAETSQSVHFEDFYPALATWYEISAYPSGNGLSVYFKNVSDRKLSEIRLKELNEDLLKQAKKLANSNAELERFAYVASHDLQEPLRMITSFLTQLEKKIWGRRGCKRETIHWFCSRWCQTHAPDHSGPPGILKGEQ